MTRTGTAKRRGSSVPLRPSEWDFRRVPNDEKMACYLYEYGREFFNASQHLQKYRQIWNNPRCKTLSKFRAMEMARDLLAAKCGCFPRISFEHFPETPWQDLPEIWPVANKRVRLRHLLAIRLSEGFHMEQRSVDERIAMRLRKQYATLESFEADHNFFHHNGSTEFGFFAINWSHSDKQIAEAFRQWLGRERADRDYRGEANKAPSGNRGGAADKLKWLGALRVRRAFPKKSLVEYGDTKLKVAAPYSHYPDLIEAAKKAESEIGNLFSSDWDEAAWRKAERLSTFVVDKNNIRIGY